MQHPFQERKSRFRMRSPKNEIILVTVTWSGSSPIYSYKSHQWHPNNNLQWPTQSMYIYISIQINTNIESKTLWECTFLTCFIASFILDIMLPCVLIYDIYIYIYMYMSNLHPRTHRRTCSGFCQHSCSDGTFCVKRGTSLQAPSKPGRWHDFFNEDLLT